jgi:hypothetical protein
MPLEYGATEVLASANLYLLLAITFVSPPTGPRFARPDDRRSEAISLAQSELKAGTHDATRALATAVQAGREQDLSRLQSLLPS